MTIQEFNNKLAKMTSVTEASKHYGKNVDEIIKALQCRVCVRRYKNGEVKRISIDFTDNESGINIKLINK
jgi:hypothetical protein